jgi:hypothetical protein
LSHAKVFGGSYGVRLLSAIVLVRGFFAVSLEKKGEQNEA